MLSFRLLMPQVVYCTSKNCYEDGYRPEFQIPCACQPRLPVRLFSLLPVVLLSLLPVVLLSSLLPPLLLRRQQRRPPAS